MWLFNLILIIFATLIIFVISSTIIKLALFLTVRYKYENYLLILPSFLNILAWIIIVICANLLLNIYFKGNFISLILTNYLEHISLNEYILPLLIVFLISSLIGIFIQALIYLTINIDYSKMNGNLRYTLKKIFRVKPKKNTGLTTYIKPERLTLKDTLIASFLTFTSIIFFTIILLYIGSLISNKIISF